MYPLNVALAPPKIGFAVANDEGEHAALTVAGYLPAFIKPVALPVQLPPTEITEETHDADLQTPEEQALRASLIARAEDKGIKVDGRWSDKRLSEEIEKG